MSPNAPACFLRRCDDDENSTQITNNQGGSLPPTSRRRTMDCREALADSCRGNGPARTRSGSGSALDVVGPGNAVRIFGVKLVGITLENGQKLLLTAVVLFVFWGFGALLPKFRSRAMSRAGVEGNEQYA